MTRWRPTRAGLLNVWRYYDEVLTFEDGRLLLRGPNGTGKSKALELLLPFLLDADLRASRLSTFGSGTRSMHWNLMGQGAAGATRVGYVWLELGRRAGTDAAESEVGEHVTIGARLQASRADTKTRVAYFVLRGRVGLDLELTADGAPLTVGALRDALTGQGDVFENDAAGYRDVVRATLFPAMSPDRYETLVHALLQLRRPKLSEHLDPESLSSILSAALPPVDESRIQELAEGFERLDQQRAQLEQLRSEMGSARSLLEVTRTYARAVLRERAKAVTSAATEVDRTSKDVRRGTEELEAARVRVSEADARLSAAREQVRGQQQEREALRRSDEYRDGRALDDLRQKVRDAELVAARSADDATRAAERAALSAERALVAEDEDARAQEARTAIRTRASAVAEELGVADLVGTQDLGAFLDARDTHAAELGVLLDRHDESVRDRGRAEAALTAARAELDDAQRVLDNARAAADAAAQQYVELVLAWSRSCVELPLTEAAVLDAVDRGDAAGLARDVLALVLRDLQQGVDRLERERTDLSTAREELEARRAELEARRPVAPPVPRFRSTDAGAASGARLWQLVDFADDVPEDARAGLEAALESSGLLDAWVSTSGQVRVDGHDVVLDPATPVTDEERLSRFLHPDDAGSGEVDRPSAETVRRVLDAIGMSRGGGEPGPAVQSWVAEDGRWRLGVARGSWSKPAAQYIGASAREHHRLLRIAELDAQITAAASRLDELAGDVAAAVSRMDAARAEADAAPSSDALTAARRGVELAETVVAERDRRTAHAVQGRDDAEEEVVATHRAVTTAAERLRLPSTRAALADVVMWVARLRAAAHDLTGATLHAAATAGTAQRERDRVTTDTEEAADLADRALADASRARDQRVGLQALEQHLGAAYERIVARLTELDDAVAEGQRSLPALDRRLKDATERAGKIDGRIEGARTAHAEAQQRREEVHEAFVALLGTTLATDADVVVDLPPEDRVRAVLETARQVDRDLPAARADESTTSALNRLTQRLAETAGKLAARAQLELSEQAGVTVPVAVRAGRRTGLRELVRTIEDERERTAAEITAHEHGLFERALTGDTRRHLSEAIRDAHELVLRMNERLLSVRTASDVQVRLRWVVRDEQGDALREARGLLMKNPARLADAEHEALHRFFRERIDEAHAQDAGRSWAQQLATVFDYTAWHRFQVEMSRPDGQGWRTLTRQAHGVLSGGEKAIALHLPLFAALAAHYEATPSGPRLILLDEVFVGIDTVNRGQIFALLRELDLDLFLTSDHEWATYPEVDAIAIHVLAAGADDEAVTTTRFVWTGHELTEDPVDVLFA